MRSSRTASSPTIVAAVLATVALSVTLFFVFTLPGIKKGRGGGPTAEGKELDSQAGEGDPVDPAEPAELEPELQEPGPTVPAAEAFRRSPGALVAELARRIEAGELDAAGRLLAGVEGASPIALNALFGAGGYAPAADQPPAEVGVVNDMTRWVLPLRARDHEDTGIPAERLFLDLARAPADPSAAPGDRPWELRRVILTPAMQRLIAGGSSAEPPGEAGTPDGLGGEQDAMVMADAFITAVNGKNFEAALKQCSPEVSEEKIAGLCIVFEEGSFRLRAERPLIATAIGADTAWVIAHVVSDTVGASTEFGLEMKRDPASSDWMIDGINFGKMLDTYVTASEAGKVPYTPIKTQPDSGELLVLYFEYDSDALLPRAKRQLGILAGILKADRDKQLRIAGHADALGPESYNAALSAARALSVKNQLVAFGVPDEQIDTTGFGEARPWKPNLRDDGTDDPKGRSYNRRAEIYLEFSG